MEIRFLRVEDAVPLEDRLERVKFSCMSWTHDGKGLFYNSYPDQEGKSDGKASTLSAQLSLIKEANKNASGVIIHLLHMSLLLLSLCTLPLLGDGYRTMMCCLLGTETSTNLHQKLYFHVLGTPQSEDVLCAEFPDHPKWMSGAEVREEDQLTDVSSACADRSSGGL